MAERDNRFVVFTPVLIGLRAASQGRTADRENKMAFCGNRGVSAWVKGLPQSTEAQTTTATGVAVLVLL